MFIFSYAKGLIAANSKKLKDVPTVYPRMRAPLRSIEVGL